MSDLISRERLINEWDDLGRRYAMPTTPIHKRAFREFPSADVRENIRGEWLRMSDLPEDKDDRYKCSNCGTVVHYSNGVNLYHFNSWCGRCGSLNNSLIADMRGEHE